MLTILHAADLHLDSPFRDLSSEQAAQRRKEQRELPGRLAELARERGADLVLLAGDLLDGEVCYRETAEAMATALGQTGCPVFIAPGNHDPITGSSPYRGLVWPRNVHIFQSEQVESVALPELGCTVHGTAFVTGQREDDPLSGFSAPQDGQIHLMVAHGDVGGRQYAPIAPASIAASGLQYLALGHVHACSGLQKEGKTHWAYPGCPEGRGFDECGEKGVLLVQLDGDRVTAEFIPLSTRRYLRLDVSPEGKDPREALSQALTGHEADICRVTLSGECDRLPDLPALERELGEMCFALSLRDRTTPVRDIWARAGEDSLTGLFLREMRSRLDETADGEDRAMLELAVRFGLAALERGEDCRP